MLKEFIFLCALSLSVGTGTAADREFVGAVEKVALRQSDWILKGKGGRSTIDSGGFEYYLSHSPAGFAYWLSPPLELSPDSIYKLSLAVLARNRGGTPEVGLTSYNKSLGNRLPRKWVARHFVFAAPSRIIPERSRLRLGQYGVRSGSVRYKNVSLVKVEPVYAKFGDIILGDGEALYDDKYQFITKYNIRGNQSRPLKAFQCAFNSNRWVFFKDDYVIYSHTIPDALQISARVELHIDWRRGGSVVAEARSSKSDGGKWTALGTVSKPDESAFILPARLFPAKTVEIRLRASGCHPFRGDFDPGSIQVGAYRYFAVLNKKRQKILKGKTIYRTFKK